MDTTRLKQARALWPHSPGVPRHIVRHNRRAWVKALRQLGGKWVYATPIKLVALQRGL